MGVVEVLNPVAPARAGGWKVDVSRGERNGRVSSEWFNRPDDERYLSLDDLWASVKGRSERSRSRVVQTADIRVEAARDKPERLHLMLPKAEAPVAPTHWAFGQLASIVGAPASYLRQLPAPLAGINLQYGLTNHRAEQVKTFETEDGRTELRAVTGPDYGRIHDFELVEAVQRIAGNGTGDTRWKVPGVAPLIRLFFSDLIASLQAQEPGDDEPWPVMIMLDEFDRLGKMPIVAESIKTLRSFGGNLAIVTQTIPALDEIYGENTRRSLQGGAGVKLYLTPSEQKTIEELSQAVGKTTKRVVTRSRAVGRNPFEGRSVSERTEDTPLLTEDEARRMDLDEVILVIDAQMPIRARRVKYFEDPALKVLHEGQAGSFPYPDEDGLRRDRQMSETRETVEKLKQELQEVRAANVARAVDAAKLSKNAPYSSAKARGRAARAAASGGGQGRLSLDIEGLGITGAERKALASAVQTTRAIIAEHG